MKSTLPTNSTDKVPGLKFSDLQPEEKRLVSLLREGNKAETIKMAIEAKLRDLTGKVSSSRLAEHVVDLYWHIDARIYLPVRSAERRAKAARAQTYRLIHYRTVQTAKRRLVIATVPPALDNFPTVEMWFEALTNWLIDCGARRQEIKTGRAMGLKDLPVKPCGCTVMHPVNEQTEIECQLTRLSEQPPAPNLSNIEAWYNDVIDWYIKCGHQKQNLIHEQTDEEAA